MVPPRAVSPPPRGFARHPMNVAAALDDPERPAGLQPSAVVAPRAGVRGRALLACADREACSRCGRAGLAEMATGHGASPTRVDRAAPSASGAGLADVRSARAPPADLRAMFLSEVADKGAHPARGGGGPDLRDAGAGNPGGEATGHVRGGDPRELAVAAWALAQAGPPCSSTGASATMPVRQGRGTAGGARAGRVHDRAGGALSRWK